MSKDDGLSETTDDRQWLPFRFRQVKRKPDVGPSEIQCHVDDCSSIVAKPRRNEDCSDESVCATHSIHVHSSTYRCRDWHDNLLWHGREDQERIDWFASHKREGRDRGPGQPRLERMAHENSEDAVTWNVFRGFERAGCAGHLLPVLTGGALAEAPATIFYWGLQFPEGPWGPFSRVSHAVFDEPLGRGTETDLIVYSPGRALIFLEAKFGSGNESDKPLRERYKLVSWFNEAMKSDASAHYQLARNWLLGTYLATNDLKVPFWLVSLVREQDGREENIESEFHGRSCNPRQGWTFRRGTWEEIARSGVPYLPDKERSTLTRYFAEKTLSLKKAFNV